MWKITIHVVAFLVNQYIPAWIILLGDPLSTCKCQHGQCRTTKSGVLPMPAFTKSTLFQTLETFQTMYITKQIPWHSLS